MKYSEYKGNEIEKLPFDIGKIFFTLRSHVLSEIVDEHIYKNDKGYLFHVDGTDQYTDIWKQSSKDDKKYYHLVRVIPVKNYHKFPECLKGEIKLSELFDYNEPYYILKLNLHDNGEELTLRDYDNNKQIEVLDLECYSVKECKMSDLDGVSSVILEEFVYKHRNEIDWNFNEESDRLIIDKIIKDGYRKDS